MSLQCIQTPKYTFMLTSVFIHGSFPKRVVEEHPEMAGESEGDCDDEGKEITSRK